MTTIETQGRVRYVVAKAGRPVSAKYVAGELGIQTGWASHILGELVARGIVDVNPGPPGTGELRWSAS